MSIGDRFSVALGDELKGKLDDDMFDYLCSALEQTTDEDELVESTSPFLVDAECAADDDEVRAIIKRFLSGPATQEQSTGDSNGAAAPDSDQADGAPAAPGDVAASSGPATLLTAPVDLGQLTRKQLARQGVPLWQEKEERLSLVNKQKLEDNKRQYLERKRLREERSKRMEAVKHAESLKALALLREAEAVFRRTDHSNSGGQSSGPVDLVLENFDVQAGANVLVKHCTLTLVHGRRYALVGRNGVGKTSFLRALAGRELSVPKGTSILLVAQEATGSAVSAIEAVLECDAERKELLEAVEAHEHAEQEATSRGQQTSASPDFMSPSKLAKVLARLDEIDAYSAESRAQAILAGLGFTAAMQEQRTDSFSGGWRMRIALARALFAEPDLLLLDEPTNHLDLYAVLWLEQFLLSWPRTLVCVSHQREFLNGVATDVLHLHNQAITPYRGNYDQFEITREQRQKDQARAHSASVKHRAHLQSFVERFRFKAKLAKLAQSRLKTLEKMRVVPEVLEDPEIAFSFVDPPPLNPPLLQLQDVSFSYGDRDEARKVAPGHHLLNGVSLNLDLDSRVALVGANGAGKSTLVKLLAGELDATTGFVQRASRLSFGVFAQHFVDQLDLAKTPVEQMMDTFPGMKMPEARGLLNGFGIVGQCQLRSIAFLSGGQKSRVAIAIMAHRKPAMLLLDEISNHLDLDTIDALALALGNFTGGVVLISHDEHLINMVADTIYVVDEGKCELHDGDFASYKKKLLKS